MKIDLILNVFLLMLNQSISQSVNDKFIDEHDIQFSHRLSAFYKKNIYDSLNPILSSLKDYHLKLEILFGDLLKQSSCIN